MEGYLDRLYKKTRKRFPPRKKLPPKRDVVSIRKKAKKW